jgi:hypothetical protein
VIHLFVGFVATITPLHEGFCLTQSSGMIWMCVVVSGGDMNDFNCFSNQALSACGIVKVTNGGLSAGWRCEKAMM